MSVRVDSGFDVSAGWRRMERRVGLVAVNGWGKLSRRHAGGLLCSCARLSESAFSNMAESTPYVSTGGDLLEWVLTGPSFVPLTGQACKEAFRMISSMQEYGKHYLEEQFT